MRGEDHAEAIGEERWQLRVDQRAGHVIHTTGTPARAADVPCLARILEVVKHICDGVCERHINSVWGAKAPAESRSLGAKSRGGAGVEKCA